MPLVAMDKNTRQRLDIVGVENPREVFVAEDLVCPICSSPMIIVSASVLAGEVVRIAHFRHHDIRDCPYTAYGKGESEEHLSAKAWLRDMLRRDAGFAVPVELEFHLPQIGRIADVAQIFPNGWIVVHEIQLASITPEMLNQRSSDYLAAGCDVVWYLGKNAATRTNRDWVREFQGFEALIQWEEYRVDRHRIELPAEPAASAPTGTLDAQPNGALLGVRP